MFKMTLVLVLAGFAVIAQKNLVLKENQIARITTNVDRLTVDTLVMNDRSTLLFDGRKNMYLQVNHLIVGKGCKLEGTGPDGKHGNTLPYTGAYSSNRTPSDIRGDGGWMGGNGTNLFLTIKNMVVQDTLTIINPGGNGGNGTSVPTLNVLNSRPGVSTLNYNANNPYNGLPGQGGNGGRGGNIVIAYSPAVQEYLGRIVIMNYGGLAGQMGDTNPMNIIPTPTSVLDPQARANDPRFVRKVRTEGKPGKVKLMKLEE